MASKKQRRANCANAKKSTGPRTTPGKNRSRMNALKHGILSSETLIADGETKEDTAALKALRDDLQADLSPSGTLEELLVDRLVADIWRLRRILRYETGATREGADEAVATWVTEQREMQRKRDAREDLFAQGVPDHPRRPPKWIEKDDLEVDLTEAEENLRALQQPDPFDGPVSDLGWALVRALEDYGLDAKALLELDASDDLYEEIDSGLSRKQLERLFEELRLSESPSACWRRLRVHAELKRDLAMEELAHRKRQEERLKMMAAIPPDAALDRVLRYEAHLSREFDRILRRLNERQSSRQS